MSSFMGMKVVTRPETTRTEYDWSRCRSRSRAERRHKQGHRQNVVIREVPDDRVYMVGGNLVMTDYQRRMVEYATRTMDFQELFMCQPEPPSAAFVSGYEAAKQGRARLTCPFFAQSLAAQEWLSGWKEYQKHGR